MSKRRIISRLSYMLRINSPTNLRWLGFVCVLIVYFISYRIFEETPESKSSNLHTKHQKLVQYAENQNPDQQSSKATTPTCHQNVCHKTNPNKLNVHIVPHTHDDTGWLKTVDIYYQDQVQYILSNVITELDKNPDRRFIYVEIAFFERWWRRQCSVTKDLVKKLVNSGQLQFTLGHWSMPDEAVTHYNDIITNAELGMRFLEENFGECGRPLVAWQIARVF